MTHPPTLRSVLPVLGTLLALLAGCGESRTYSLSPGHIDKDSVPPSACFEGAEVELLRYSTRCERASASSLKATVGDGLEFGAEAVATLEAPCARGPNPGVEVSIERHSVVFDFSKVSGPGRFPRADFEGYVIDLSLRQDNALLVAASVDTERSTSDLREADIYHEPDHIEVNLQGLPYDEKGLLEIDLWFANVIHETDGAP